MASPSVSLASYLQLTREHHNFRKLWLAQIISEIGDWFYTIAIFSLLLELTGRAASVALGLVLWVLPQTFIGPIAGAVNDRISRRKVMIIADVMRAVIVALMLLVRTRRAVWAIYPLLVLETVMAGFFEPARNSVIPNIIPNEKVLAANTLASATWSFDLAIGSLLGGVAAALLGRDSVFLMNAASFLVSALLISRMRFAEPHVTQARLKLRELFDYSPMAEGFHYILHDRKLTAMVALRGGAGFLGASWVLFPVLGQRVFHVRTFGHADYAMVGMSLLLTGRGTGALLGPLIAAPWAGSNQSRLRRGVLIGFMLGGLGYTLLGISPNILVGVLVVLLAHIGGSTVWVFSTTLLHLNTEDRFRGRIFAADLGFAMAVIAVSAWIAGQAIDRGVPPRLVTVGVGLSMLIPTVAWSFALRLWKASEPDPGLRASV